MTEHEIIKKFSEIYLSTIENILYSKSESQKEVYIVVEFEEDYVTVVATDDYFIVYGSIYYFYIDELHEDVGWTTPSCETASFLPLQFLIDIKNLSQIEMKLRYGQYCNILPIDYINFLNGNSSCIISKLLDPKK